MSEEPITGRCAAAGRCQLGRLRCDGTPQRRIDAEYGICGGELVKLSTGERVPADEPLFLLRARDRLALPLIEVYRVRCKYARCSDHHVRGVQDALDAFTIFARRFLGRMRKPGEGKE